MPVPLARFGISRMNADTSFKTSRSFTLYHDSPFALNLQAASLIISFSPVRSRTRASRSISVRSVNGAERICLLRGRIHLLRTAFHLHSRAIGPTALLWLFVRYRRKKRIYISRFSFALIISHFLWRPFCFLSIFQIFFSPSPSPVHKNFRQKILHFRKPNPSFFRF